MSYSGLIEQSFLLQVASLGSVVDKYRAQWIGANTVEDQQGVEQEAIDAYLRLDEHPEVTEVDTFHHLDLANLDSFYGLYELLQRSNNARLQVANQMLLTRLNNYQLMFSDLIGQVKRIKQKKAVLSLWNGERAKYFTGNKFLNTQDLGSDLISVDPCEINTNQGILTLPVQTKTDLTVSNIRIGVNSNGAAGNSDIAVTLSNQNLKALITKNQDSFEYERLDTGPCSLTLVLELAKPEIINHISILPVDIGAPISFDVKNVIYTSSTKNSVSVHDLLPAEPGDTFTVEASQFSGPWELTHLPVEAVSIAIVLEQTASYSIKTLSSDKRLVVRDRYAIPLQAVTVSQIQYKPTGGINSTSQVLRRNLYAVEPRVNINPSNDKFYDFNLEISFDDGVTWITAGTDEENLITLIKDNQGSFVWRLTLERSSDGFSSFSSFSDEEPVKSHIKSILKTGSRFTSPLSIRLGSNPTDSPQVIQPKIGRRGDKTRSFRLGNIGVSGTNKLAVPFNILHKRIKPEEVSLYVGGTQFLRKEPGETLSALEWSFADKHDEVLISDLAPGTQVDMVLNEELMLLTEKEDGYYHSVKLDFDPDKASIDVSYLARQPSRKSILLPRGQTTIYLDTNNILAGTLTFASSIGASYTEVQSRDEVYDDTDHDYFVDYENGILYLASAISTDSVRVSFDYQSKLTLDPSSFDIIYTNALPTHIRINKDSLDAISVTETISNTNVSIIDPITGSFAPRLEIIPVGALKKKQLSNNFIIVNSFQAPVDLLENGLLPEEVDFIDGTSEFLGLTEITDEKTNELTAGASGVVSFVLSARSLWFKDLDVIFSNTSVFANKVSSQSQVTSGSLGDYFIDSDGTVYVQLEPSGILPSGIKLSYYYKSPTFDGANKYSIDYENGILYSFKQLNQSAQVTYKTATYTMSYDVAKQLTSNYSAASNSVEINTEHLHPVNNLIKVLWNENQQSDISNTIEAFFSPLISLVGFRFS